MTQVFSEYGNVIDIVAKTNLRAKGQAFIVFDSAEAAQAAITDLQGFDLFEKPMRLAMARTRSDATIKALGNDEEFELHKRRRVAEKGEMHCWSCSSGNPNQTPRQLDDTYLSAYYTDKRRAAEALEDQKRVKGVGAIQDIASRPAKPARGVGLKPTHPSAAAVVPDEYLPPNKILFVQNLPDTYDVDALTAVFSRFEGFREARTVPGRAGIAFIEYETEQGAITAKENTAGMVLGEPGQAIKVTYQRQ